MGRPEVEPKTDIAKRLRAVRAAIGIKDRDVFAERTGVSSSTIGNYERGERMPDAAMLLRYRETWDVDLNWLVTGEDGAMFLTPNTPLPLPVEEFMSRSRKKWRDKMRYGKQADERDSDAQQILDGGNGNLAYLPAYHIHASAGHGAAVDDEEVVEQIAFDRSFLADLGAHADRCSIIWAQGDSMQPTIPNGSILVVDHSQVEVRSGCIYVFNIDGDLLVKRANRKLNADLEIISDNPMYATETISADRLEQLRIVGRVVYFCRTP